MHKTLDRAPASSQASPGNLTNKTINLSPRLETSVDSQDSRDPGPYFISCNPDCVTSETIL